MNERTTRALHAGAALLAAALLPPVAGCGGHGEEGCPELCEQMAACPEPAQTEDACLSACNAETELAEEKGCADYRTDYLECAGHATAVCDPAELASECQLQLTSYEDCKR
jgi:hypothetical protein